MADQDRVWFWKEPYLSTSLAFWRDIWGDAIYIIPVRHPHETALSLDKFLISAKAQPRPRLIGSSLLRWQYFMLCILEGTAGSHRRIFVSYDRLVETPEVECRRLCTFLDELCGTQGRPEDRLQRMVEAVDPGLYRNRAAHPFDMVAEATTEQKRLYDLLLRMIDNPDEELDSYQYPMYAGWREYLENVDKIVDYYARAEPVLRDPAVNVTVAGTRLIRRLRRKMHSLLALRR